MDVIRAPDEKLRVKTRSVKKITSGLIRTAREMIKLTKTFKDPEGVGLASTQIGEAERFFIAKEGEDFQIYINPKIATSSKRTKRFFEGCLSIPNFWGEVRRPTQITVEYQNEKGEKIAKKLKGVSAWIFQHEVDHLEGKLFMDHVLEQKGKVFKVVGKDKTGADIFQEVKL